MNENTLIRVQLIDDFYRDELLWQSARGWYRLFWMPDGRGVFLHIGTFINLKLLPVKWVLLFSEVCLQNFFTQSPVYLNSLLFEPENQVSHLAMGKAKAEMLDGTLAQLKMAVDTNQEPELLQSLFNFILGVAASSFGAAKNIPVKSYTGERFRIIMGLVSAHFFLEDNSEFYSNRLNMTVQQINSICRKVKGKNLIALVRERRLAWAGIQLLCSTMSVKEISRQLGYEHIGHFSSYFKKYKGLTPTEFRHSWKGTTV